MAGNAAEGGNLQITEAITSTYFPGTVSPWVQVQGSVNQASDSAIFSPGAAALNVSEQILLTGGTAGYATVSTISQTFTETPEPSALALLAVAALGLAGRAWRRRRSAIG